MQPIEHSTGPYSYYPMTKALYEIATTAPHSCTVPECPGPENLRKVEAFDDLLEAAKTAKADGANLYPLTVAKLTLAIATAEGRE